MSFGRDLVGGAGCGTANPLLSMAGQMQGMGAQLADVRGAQFAGADKGPGAAAMMGPSGQMMRLGAGHGADAAFMNAMKQQGPAHPMGVPLHALQQQRMQHMAAQRGQPGADLADQFMAMEMQAKQQHEFEQAFAAGGPRPAVHAQPPGWAMEFAQQQQQQQHMMQQQHMRQQQHPANWANEFDQMQRMGGPRAAAAAAMSQAHSGPLHHGPMYGGMRSMGPMGMGMSMGMGMGMMGGYAPMQSHFAQAAKSSVQIQEVPAVEAATAAAAAKPADAAEAAAEEVEAEADGLYAEAEHDSLDEAYAAATGHSDWSSEFGGAAVPQEAQQMGMGGGMDRAMLDKLMHSDNPKWRNSKFLKFIEKISKGEIEFRNNEAIDKGPQAAGAGDAWASEMAAQAAAHGGDGGSADWADQFATQQSHPASWGASASAASASDATRTVGEGKSQAEQWLEDYEAQGMADTEFKDFDWQAALSRAKEQAAEAAKDPEYNFAPGNPLVDSASSAQSAFEEGVRLFGEGKLREAISAFEAAVQKDPDHADAWSHLGEAQAHNEEEHNAIAAFLRAVAIDPYNLKALLQLGISYTNDLEEGRALNYLKTWLTNNPDYQSAALQQQKQQSDQFAQLYGGDGSSSSSGALQSSHYSYDNNLHDDVARMFQSALAVRPDDPDLHTVLGVLYHISSDFDKAIASFQAAVALKPDDAALWNKLGATQANSSRSADAVHAYRRALQLRPSYVRALANLAISYANQGMHDDAVRTYLTTLSHNPSAAHVWSYLRISLAHLQRDDLVELSHKQDPQLFRPFFNF